MSRPGKKITRKTINMNNKVVLTTFNIERMNDNMNSRNMINMNSINMINMTNQMNELSLKEKACKSLLANVLDMDDDLRSDIPKLTSPFFKWMILKSYGQCPPHGR